MATETRTWGTWVAPNRTNIVQLHAPTREYEIGVDLAIPDHIEPEQNAAIWLLYQQIDALADKWMKEHAPKGVEKLGAFLEVV